MPRTPDSRRRPPDRRLLLAAQAGPRGDRRPDACRVGVVSGAEKAVHVRGARSNPRRSPTTSQARELLEPLLADDPFNADYLAAVADSYALARDDGSLRDFYKSTIEAMRRSAPAASADERTRRIAGLRRGLIPALARLNDHAGAIDQYIEILNRYPDDEPLLQEAGRYARQHARTDQLLAYYTKTAADSPRDYRWPMLLAKLETQFEHFPAAIAAYATAAAIRPDRADFQIARGRLEERLMRFDDAVASYAKTYELTYHDPQWMEKIAELRARQGRVDDAAKALRTRARRRAPRAGRDLLRRRRGGWSCGACPKRRGRSWTRARGWPGPPACSRAAARTSASTPGSASRQRSSIGCLRRGPKRRPPSGRPETSHRCRTRCPRV